MTSRKKISIFKRIKEIVSPGFTPKILIYLLLIPFFAIFFKITYQRVAAFGCFDDCFNYGAAYFMVKGKVLYSEIPFNHQMLLPYISYLVQKFFHPSTIYQLLLFHRFSLFFFSLLMSTLILVRFKLAGIGFVLFYESTKYYLFGERFLPESFIVYPLVYLFGLLWYKLERGRIFAVEYLLAGVFTWFVIFAREPYIPLAVFLYIFLLWGKDLRKAKIYSFLILFLLSFLIIFTVSFPDYLFNIINLNAETVVSTELKRNLLGEGGILKSFVYPLFIFFDGKWNIFRIFLIFLDVIFLILLWIAVVKLKKIKPVMIILFLLGLANIRIVVPGTIFYEAFHMIQWYGLFLMAIFLILGLLHRFQKRLAHFLSILLLGGLSLLILSPKSYLWDKIDRHKEFVTGYADYLSNGEVVRLLADPNDTLFLDNNRNDLVYWQAGLASSYKYSWYTWVMPGFLIYDQARLEMFRLSPPDFYYGYCPTEPASAQTMPKDQVDKYTQLYFAGRQSCLYVRKEKIKEIPPERWEKIKRYEYYLP